MARKRVLIAGAAGRDFHNFNLVYRGRDDVRGRRLHRDADPEHRRARLPARAGRARCYPDGIPIAPEDELEELVREHEVDEVVFAYSDVTHEHVMHIGSRALAAGASLPADLAARDDARLRRSRSSRSAPSAPAPARARRRGTSPRSCARRASASPSCATRCRTATWRSRPCSASSATRTSTPPTATIEEREEYEPHLAEGNLVFAGVDYAAILDRGRAGGRRDRLGRRQQRHAVRQARTCTSSSSTRTGRATSCATTRARRTCAWPTSAS